MNRRAVVFKAVLVLAFVWGTVWAVRAYAGSRKITAQSVEREIRDAEFTDLSGQEKPPQSVEGEREKHIRKIAEQINRLDFNERQRNKESRATEQFFRTLSVREKDLFLDLTVMQSMGKFMEALDAMPPAQRKKFVEQGLKEVDTGRTEQDMQRAEELGPEVLERITQEGMRAYFQKSSAETKLDLAPLMQAMNEVMQGLRGNEFGPPR